MNKNEPLYVYPHLGLGDNIICNGLIREIYSVYPNMHLCIKPQYSESVQFMYSDLKIKFIVDTEPRIRNFLDTNKFENELRIGHEFMNNDLTFDCSFYNQVGVNFIKRWTSFHVPRDASREQELFDKLTPKGDYIFVHDDNRYRLNPSLIPNIPIVRPDPSMTGNVFDYMKIIENAKEIHCMESSFMLIIDSYKTNNKIVLHKYARKHEHCWEMPVLNRPWYIIGEK
jgi:hypothetical protein